MNKKEYGLSNLDRINTWISNCDTKASIIFALIGVIMTIVLTSNYVLENLNAIFQSIWSNKSWSICTINIRYSIVILVFVIMLYYFSLIVYYLTKALTADTNINNIKENNNNINRKSNIYFGAIASKDYENFVNDCIVDESTMFNDIYSQIYINSHICNSKFTNYNKSIKKLKIGLPIFMIFILSLIVLM